MKTTTPKLLYATSIAIAMMFAAYPVRGTIHDDAVSFAVYYGLNPDAPVASNVSTNSTDTWPILVSTNGLVIGMQRERTRAQEAIRDGERVSVVVKPEPSRLSLMGHAFLFPSPTNTISRMIEPFVGATSLSPGSLERLYRFDSTLGEACFVAETFDPGDPNIRTFYGICLIKGGVCCNLRSTAVTNLVEIAEIVCDTLSPPAEE